MHEFVLKAKEPVDVYMKAFLTKDIPAEQLDEHTIVVRIEDEDLLSEFFIMLSFAMSMNVFRNTLLKEFDKRNMKDEEAEFYLAEMAEIFHNNKYYVGVTLLRLIDFFETNNTINFDSFEMFNLRSLKEEVVSRLNEVIAYHNSNHEADTQMAIRDLIEQLQSNLAETAFEKEHLREFLIKQEGDKLRMFALDGTEINEQFIFNEIGAVIKVGGEGDINPIEAQVLQTVFLANVFRPTTLKIHPSVSEEAREMYKAEKEILEQRAGQEIGIQVVFLDEE